MFLFLIAVTQVLVKKSLKLLEELPVLRDSIFDYYSLIFEVSIGNYISTEVSFSFIALLVKTFMFPLIFREMHRKRNHRMIKR